VTQRPQTEGRTTQHQTQRWLSRHGFEFPFGLHTLGSRGKIAAALTLDAHVDDRLNNAMDIASESKGRGPFSCVATESFNRISAVAAQFGITTVRTVNEVIAKLEQADSASSEGRAGDAAGRLKRVFGGGRLEAVRDVEA